ncbi:MAG: fatty-acid oxidation protein subunit alpha [Desulfobacteraceae bacterium]|nr:fatty-acid oxidation protein subunit alpha [Desulfobacteraceae bacterium]
MAAKDIFHDAVKIGLEKEGWIITHDPLYIRLKGVQMYIDIGAEKIIGAEKSGQKIAVEIKSFTGPSAISDFHSALGQYLNYQQALEDTEPDRILYMAVPIDTYDQFFTLLFVQEAVIRHKIRLILYDNHNEVISTWKN